MQTVFQTQSILLASLFYSYPLQLSLLNFLWWFQFYLLCSVFFRSRIVPVKSRTWFEGPEMNHSADGLPSKGWPSSFKAKGCCKAGVGWVTWSAIRAITSGRWLPESWCINIIHSGPEVEGGWHVEGRAVWSKQRWGGQAAQGLEDSQRSALCLWLHFPCVRGWFTPVDGQWGLGSTGALLKSPFCGRIHSRLSPDRTSYLKPSPATPVRKNSPGLLLDLRPNCLCYTGLCALW